MQSILPKQHCFYCNSSRVNRIDKFGYAVDLCVECGGQSIAPGFHYDTSLPYRPSTIINLTNQEIQEHVNRKARQCIKGECHNCSSTCRVDYYMKYSVLK